MFTKEIKTKNFKIHLILSNKKGDDISYDGPIKILTSQLICNDQSFFKFKENKIFPKNKKLIHFNNILHAIKIEHLKNEIISLKKVFFILNKNVPTIFNKKKVIEKNIRAVLQKDFENIYNSAFKILGAEVEDFHLEKRIGNNEKKMKSPLKFLKMKV